MERKFYRKGGRYLNLTATTQPVVERLKSLQLNLRKIASHFPRGFDKPDRESNAIGSSLSST
jgi:hypothetical protein